MKIGNGAIILLYGLLLVGCGGGGGGNSGNNPPSPTGTICVWDSSNWDDCTFDS